MRRLPHILFAIAVLFVAAAAAHADALLLSLRGAASDGLAIADVDLTAAAAWCKLGPIVPECLRVLDQAGKPLACQFVPGCDFDPTRHIAGKVIIRLPGGGDALVRLQVAPAAPPQQDKPFDGRVSTPWAEVVHDPARQGGLPSSILFSSTGKSFTSLRWGDRLYQTQLGSFPLATDPQARVERVGVGPLCTVIRVRSNYTQSGKRPASKPTAVYDWYYFHERPLVLVTATIQQETAFTWTESHFLELTTPEKDFLNWAGGDPVQQGQFTGTVRTFGFPSWGALLDGNNAIGMFHAGQVLFYDHLNGRGTYMQAHGDSAWQPWTDTRLNRAAWLWIGSQPNPADAIRAAAQAADPIVHAVVQVDSLRQAIDVAAQRIRSMPPEARRQAWWHVAAAQQLLEQSRFDEAMQAASGKPPAGWTILNSGDLSLIFARTNDGVKLVSLHDIATDRQISAAAAPPLFKVTLRNVRTKELASIVADSGWSSIDVRTDRAESPRSLSIRWRNPQDARLGDLTVSVRGELDAGVSAIRWSMSVQNVDAAWSVWQVTFPQLAAADLGAGTQTLFPRGSGEVQADVGRRGFRYGGRYPGGWTSIPLAAVYAADRRVGLYFAMHDPLGSTKEITVHGRPADRSVLLAFEHPAPDMGVAANGFTLPGQAVWQLFRGDWFDAALIYRTWMRAHARWFPQLGPDGRPDTPRWMRELAVWVMTGGGPAEVEKPVADFARKVGLPVGFHWYSWHQIPFDNDYPHYFPTKPGFAEAVHRLQQSNVHVMPYINGRLWDTRDRGMEDFEFTKIARPAATKDEKGEPNMEQYGSKEKDGSPVRLAVMCPATPLWQGKASQIVGRLFNECGTDAVYVDQVAAAQPALCFDKTHGHPLGGGSWWTAGYWKMFDQIRRERPADRVLTTECNAEPFINCFDGYLTWHWQYDGQVPLFPAIYGGSIQMFGRAYRGGPSKDLAMRMKAGQQLVFGEQIGWFDPRIINEKPAADFLLPLIKLRWELRRYFYAGEMARPPRLIGTVPRVTADWQWSGVWPVSTDAILCSTWRQPAQNRTVLLFVNVSDRPVTARVEFDAGEYGAASAALRITPRAASGAPAPFTSPPKISRQVTFPPLQSFAWEF